MERKENYGKYQGSVKKSKALNYLALGLFSFYFILMVISFTLNLQFHTIWFSVALFFIGGFLVFKAMLFYLDSSMLFGFFALFFGAISGYLYFVDFEYVLELYIFGIGLTNFIMFFIFRQNFYIILFALTIFEMLLLIANRIFMVDSFWVYQSLYFILVLIVFTLMMIKIKEH